MSFEQKESSLARQESFWDYRIWDPIKRLLLGRKSELSSNHSSNSNSSDQQPSLLVATAPEEVEIFSDNIKPTLSEELPELTSKKLSPKKAAILERQIKRKELQQIKDPKLTHPNSVERLKEKYRRFYQNS